MKKNIENFLEQFELQSFFLLENLHKQRANHFYKSVSRGNPPGDIEEWYGTNKIEIFQLFNILQKCKTLKKKKMKKKGGRFHKNLSITPSRKKEPLTKTKKEFFLSKGHSPFDSIRKKEIPLPMGVWGTSPVPFRMEWKKKARNKNIEFPVVFKKTNLFFSSIQSNGQSCHGNPQPFPNRKKAPQPYEPVSQNQKLLRTFFSYGIDFSSSFSSFLGESIRFHWIKVNNFSQNSQYVLAIILFYLKKRIPYRRIRTILTQEFKKIPYMTGVQFTYSGRLGGKTNKAIRSKVETFRMGQPTLHMFSAKLDFAKGDVCTKFGMAGVKVWIRYASNKKNNMKKLPKNRSLY